MPKKSAERIIRNLKDSGIPHILIVLENGKFKISKNATEDHIKEVLELLTDGQGSPFINASQIHQMIDEVFQEYEESES